MLIVIYNANYLFYIYISIKSNNKYLRPSDFVISNKNKNDYFSVCFSTSIHFLQTWLNADSVKTIQFFLKKGSSRKRGLIDQNSQPSL